MRDGPMDDEVVELVLFDTPVRQSPGYAGKVSDQRLLENLRSFVAPIANDASAVVGDSRALQMARDLSEVSLNMRGSQHPAPRACRYSPGTGRSSAFLSTWSRSPRRMSSMGSWCGPAVAAGSTGGSSAT